MAMRPGKAVHWAALVLGAAVALVIWGLLTVLATRPGLKVLWDVSPQARFSVEPATAELLDKVRESGQTLELHTLFLPLGSYQARSAEEQQQLAVQRRLQELTRDLLRQYDYLGGDAVQVTDHDLLRRPGDVREVVREVQNRRYNSVIVKLGGRSSVLSLEADMAEFDTPRDTSPGAVPGAAVPILRDFKGEEALSTAIKKLLVAGSPIVYFLTEGQVSVEGLGPSYSSLMAALEDEGFDVRFLDLVQVGRVPDEAAAVALINPVREITPESADALYRYVRGGGRLLLNPRAHVTPPDWTVSLASLGERFGFELSPEMVCEAVRDPANPRRSLTGIPQCQNLFAFGMNPVHPITAPLVRQQRIPRFKMGREVRALASPPEGVRVDNSLLRTGPEAWLEPIDGRIDYVPTQPLTSLSFGAVVDVDGAGGKTGHVVVVAAEGFDNLSFQWNGDFALNLFNWLADRDALVSIRGRRYVSRQLDLSPQQLDRIGLLLVAGVPGALLALGLTVFFFRRRV